MSDIVFPNSEKPRDQIRPDLFERFTIVINGSIETVEGDDVFILTPGDFCHIRPCPQGKTLALDQDEAILIDVFEPVRTEYVAEAAASSRGRDEIEL